MAATPGRLGIPVLCVLFVAAAGPLAAIPRAQRATGNTSTNQSSTAVTVHVGPDGNDDFDGLSPASAVRTITRAVNLARPRLQQGVSTRILIAAGVYREGNISINAGQIGGSAGSTLLVIEGAQPGTTTISGSVTQGWEPSTWTLYDQERFVYQHTWPYAWGAAGYPSQSDPYPELLQRREMIVVNGRIVKQWLKLAVSVDGTLVPNGFFVDETAGRVYMRLDRALVPSDIIEVPDKEVLMIIDSKGNLVLRNLIFTHANSYTWKNETWGRAVAIIPRAAANILLENCAFLRNNGAGAHLTYATNTTARACTFSNNGWKGLDISSGNNVLVESCRADSNSWRQNWAHHLGIDAAGVKVTVSNRVTFFRDTCIWNNPSEGIWFDYDNRNMYFDRCHLPVAPHGAPLFIEASPGPLTITNCAAGMVAIVGSKDVTIDSCNLTQPIVVAEQERRQVGGWTAINERFGIHHNTIKAGARAIDATLPLDLWQRFQESLESDYNSWISGGNARCFRDRTDQPVSFAQWQALGFDLHSVFLDPPATSAPRPCPAAQAPVRGAALAAYAPDGRILPWTVGPGMRPAGVHVLKLEDGNLKCVGGWPQWLTSTRKKP